MKRSINIFTWAFLIAVLGGCGSKNPNTSSGDSSTLSQNSYIEHVREIHLIDMKVKFVEGGKPLHPAIVNSMEELASNEALKDAAALIGKEVDFNHEKLVFFRWGGSDDDKLEANPKKLGTFRYTWGIRTRSYRTYSYLFAVPKNVDVKVNPLDGTRIAEVYACSSVTAIFNSKTYESKKYFCNQTPSILEPTGFGTNALDLCISKCSSSRNAPNECDQDCRGRFHKFCTTEVCVKE